MYKATTANAPKMYRELSPSDMLNAAPGLNASVNRTNSPTIGCGTCCGIRYRTARNFVITSSTITTTAAVQNTRPFLADELMSRSVLRELSRLAAHRRRSRDGHIPRLAVLAPQHPGEEERPEAHCHVGDVECRPSRIAKADVDEVHDAVRRTDPVDQVAHRPATHQRESERTGHVARTRRRVQPAQNDQRDDRQHHEDPTRVGSHVQTERRTRVVHERQANPFAVHRVRQAGWNQS